MKILLVALAFFFIGLGIIGVIVPGMPTTVFLLIASALLVRSNDRLHQWLLNHKVLGKFIKDYEQHRAMPLKSKIIAIIMMTSMVSLSVFVFIKVLWVKWLVGIIGIIGFVVLLRVPVLKKEEIEKDI
ncbi:MAG TPA: DUF454 domain-containing protein [Flavobacteriales bacterium]|jgi:uncharacterized membrane protein YbaN (DUF454 family)|nr:DUF454 domain-containing protein [Flavobacteriales bacterium]